MNQDAFSINCPLTYHITVFGTDDKRQVGVGDFRFRSLGDKLANWSVFAIDGVTCMTHGKRDSWFGAPSTGRGNGRQTSLIWTRRRKQSIRRQTMLVYYRHASSGR